MAFLRFFFLSILCSLLFTCMPDHSGKQAPVAKQGVIDLRDWDFKKDGPVDLKGEWEFYWQHLYQGNEQGLGSTITPDAFFPVPKRWRKFKLDNGSVVTDDGYATLRLKILLPEIQTAIEEDSLRLFLGSSDTAFFLEAQDIQGNPLARPLQGGKVSHSKENYLPMWRRDSTPIARQQSEQQSPQQEIQIIWHISSFDMKGTGGGPKKNPRLGFDHQLTLEQETERSFNFFVIGILIIMGIYHLIIFTLRPADSAPLWFGWSCLFLALYTISTSHYIAQAFPDAHYFELHTKVIFLCATFPSVFMVLFVRSLFITYADGYFWKLLIVFCFAYAIFIVLTPVNTYGGSYFIFALIGGLSYIWSFVVYIKAIRNERSLIATLLLLGSGLYNLAAFNDLLVANATLNTPYVAAYGLSIFILFQAIVIAIQNQKAHQEKYLAQELAAASNHKALQAEQKALEEQKNLTASFQRFVPADFLRLLEKKRIQDVQLGDFVKKNMSILFSDIRSFTTLSESMSPEDNFKFLNSYLKRMEPIIHKNHGVIDKYIGDAIMATFARHADDSVQTAVDMLLELRLYNEHRQKSNYPPISIGIGINTGDLMLGTIGGKDRMEGTVISDAVNLASRLESLTKLYGASIAISQYTLEQLSLNNKFQTRILDIVKVKGKNDPVIIYEILNGETTEIQELKIQSGKFIESALTLRKENKIKEARENLIMGLQIYPVDKTIKQHLQVLENLEKFGVPEGWQGVVSLDSK